MRCGGFQKGVDQHRLDERMPGKFHKRCRVGILFKERRLLLRTQSTIRRLSAGSVKFAKAWTTAQRHEKARRRTCIHRRHAACEFKAKMLTYCVGIPTPGRSRHIRLMMDSIGVRCNLKRPLCSFTNALPYAFFAPLSFPKIPSAGPEGESRQHHMRCLPSAICLRCSSNHCI